MPFIDPPPPSQLKKYERHCHKFDDQHLAKNHTAGTYGRDYLHSTETESRVEE